MNKTFKRIISFTLILGMMLSMMPVLNFDAEAAVTSGINDMTALDALGIDISKAPLGYDPNTTDNPFGREVTSIAVVDELFMVGRSNDIENYSKLYGDNWAVGGSIDNFFKETPASVGNATNGSKYVLLSPGYDYAERDEVLGANALAMTEANLDMSKNNGRRKDSVAYVSYKFDNPGIEPRSIFSIGLIDPKYHNNGENDLHTTMHNVLVSEGNLFGNNEDKSGENEFKNEYLASTYLKITSGDYDGDGIDEIAVYVPSVDNPRIEIYKVSYDWKEDGYTKLDRTMIFQLDKYKATKFLTGAVPTNIGDTLIPNTVSLVSSDFDMDGIYDLAISYGYTGSAMDFAPCKAEMIFGEKAGRFGSRTQNIPLSYNGTSIVRASFATGDIDGDGEKELVVGGSLASVNFNPNERYVAVYKWNGSSFSATQSKRFNLFEKDNSGNYVNSNIPDSKTQYYSLPVAPANIAIGHFNGITEPVNIYIDSILIELGDNGMEIVSLLDDNLRTPSNDYAEWGARVAQLSGNGTDTLITMTSDITHITPTKKSFVEYYGEIIASFNNPSIEKAYMKAVYGSDSGIKIWKNEVKGMGFCLPNTDKDSSSVRYTGEHYYTYIDPKILAVLVSPPYFKDLINGEVGEDTEPSSTSYGTTKGSGSGSSYSNTLSVGLYTSYEKSVSLFGVELFRYEAELEVNNHMTWETLNTSTIEQAVTYETLSGQDTVVFFSMPVETYVYEQTYPVTDKDGVFLRTETQSMTVNIPHEASVRNLPLETYERIAADYDELPKISGTVLKHTMGIPSTYPNSAKGYGSTGTYGLPTIISQGDPAKIGYGASSQTKEIAMTSSTENSFNYELDISTKIGAGGGGLMVGITAGYAHGAGSVNISTSGSSYSGTLYALPTSAEAHGYDFNWKLFTYPYENGEQVFPVVSYIVSDITQPPMLPDNFVQLDLGTTQEDVALSWQHSGNPKGFIIYRYFRGAGSAGFYEVANVSAGDMDYIVSIDGSAKTYLFIDKGLTPDTEYLYRIQTVGNSEPSLSIESETLTAYTKPEGIIPNVQISTDELTIYPDTEHTASVTLTNADELSGGTLYFQWQKYDAAAKKWLDLATLNTMSIRFIDAGLDDEGFYRCKVTSRQNTIIVSSFSPVLDVKYSKRTVLMEGLEAKRNLDSGTLSVKLSGVGTKTIPGGTVVFKLEAEGYSKQYATSVNNQGIATVEISTVPGVYKVTADYNGNRVFKSSSTDRDANGNGVFYVYGQEVSGSYYWDYAENYTYGDGLKFTKYTMDPSGTILNTEDIDFSNVIAEGQKLWRKMELYELPSIDSNVGVLNPLLYKASVYSGDTPYQPLICNEAGSCTHGVENVLGDYYSTVINRFKSGKAGWVGSYYIPYDLDGDGQVKGYDRAENEESFVYSPMENPEGFYFTINKAELKVNFKDEYKDLVKSISEIELFEEIKVVLTEDNYSDYGFTEDEWNIFAASFFRQSDVQRELPIDGKYVPCKYNIYTNVEIENEKRLDLTYSPLEPNGPGAELAKNKNALTAKGQMFNDDPLETVAADNIKDTGLFDKGYVVWSYTYPEHGGERFDDERLLTYPVNLWAFEGHYYERPGYDGNGDVAPFVVGKEESSERPLDNHYPEHGLNVFRYDRFGARFPITKVMGESPQTAGQFTLGIEPTYYLNSYKASDNYRLAYIRPHIAENYDITFGSVIMTVTGAAYTVSVESDDITKGSAQLVNPITGTSRKYPIGTQLIFVASPNEGFEVDYWEVNGEKNQEGGSQLKVTQIMGGISVKVYFKAKVNTINYMIEPENAYVDGQLAVNKIICSIPSGKELMVGAEINMTADAAQGYHFIKWEIHTEGAPTQYKEGINLKTVMPNSNIRIYGIFERDTYSLILGENLIALVENELIDDSKPIAGDTIITVKPDKGYEIVGEWQVTEGIQDLDNEDGTFTFKLLKDSEVFADINSGTYEVTIADAEGGEINVSGAEDLTKVTGGTELKFTALAKRGYKVEKWIVNGESINNNYSTFNCTVDGNLNVSVSFVEKNHKDVYVSVDGTSQAQMVYTINNIDYSLIYIDAKITLYEDETLTVKAIVGINSMVAGWSIDGNYNQSYANTFTVAYADTVENIKVFTRSMFNNKIEFSTIYEGSESTDLIPSLTVTTDGVDITNGSLVGAGKKLTFTFSGEGVSVSRWTISYNDGEETDILDENNKPISDNILEIPYTLNDAKIRAYYKLNSEFEEQTYTVTVEDDGKGTGTASLSSAIAGTEISLSATPSAGYKFKEWQVVSGGVEISENKFIMPANDVTVIAIFEEIPAKVISVTISPKSTSIVAGSSTTFSAIVAGSGLYDETVTWSVYGNENIDTTINKIGVLTVDAKETATSLTVEAKSNGDKNVSDSATVTVTDTPIRIYTAKVNNGSGSGSYAKNAIVSIIADLAPRGQEFDKWTSEDVTFADETASVTTFTMPDKDVEVTALYKEIEVITHKVTLNGSGTGAKGEGNYAAGNSVRIYSGIRSNYSFNGWTSSEQVTFADINSETTTFTMIDKPVTVTANWSYAGGTGGGGGDSNGSGGSPAPVAVLYNIIAKAGYGGNITPKFATVESRGSETFTIRPNEGFVISDVLVNGYSIGVVSTYTFTNVEKDSTIEAVFAQKLESVKFLDVNDDDWFAKSVEYVVNLGLFKGTDQNTFSPNTSMTRGMFVTALGRLYEFMTNHSLVQPEKLLFGDVSPNMYYAPSVKWASDNNIISGYEGEQFKPDELITREQIVAIMYRFAVYAGLDTTNTTDITIFTDSTEISSWAVEAVKWATGSGIMTGRTDGTIDPKGLVQRCEVSAILHRFIVNFIK